MAVVHGLEDPEVQAKMQKANAAYFDPRIDRNLTRKPERYIHIFSISRREHTVDRAPLWVKFILRACPAGERYVKCASIPDPLPQVVHDTATGKQRGEAHDGLRCTIDLLNPNNPTNDPDWNPSPELKAFFSSSKNCDLFAQGLFISFDEEPSEREIKKAEERRARYYRSLIVHADRLEAMNRKELEEFLVGEDGTDLRLALDHFGEQRSYHKPMIATASCPNCGDSIKSGIAFHKSDATGALCIIDWQRAVKAGVRTKEDVPEDERWWNEDSAGEDDARPAGSRRGRRQ